MEQFFKWEGKAHSVAMQDKHQFIILPLSIIPNVRTTRTMMESHLTLYVKLFMLNPRHFSAMLTNMAFCKVQGNLSN